MRNRIKYSLLLVLSLVIPSAFADDKVYGMANIQRGQGFTLMIVGIVVVFAALVLLLYAMKLLKAYQDWVRERQRDRDRKAREAQEAAKKAKEEAERKKNDSSDIEGVVAAAIALTIILEEQNIHDDESMVLTLRNLNKPYSNWWQGDLSSAWPVNATSGNPRAMQTIDPERGKNV